jgi:cyclopropane fatty-acyl-phospholipid synthase-like methyltransferase
MSSWTFLSALLSRIVLWLRYCVGYFLGIRTDPTLRKLKSKWKPMSHEFGVEHFYEAGLVLQHRYHDSYLNFGYWEKTTEYKQACRDCVRKVIEGLEISPDTRVLDVAVGMGEQDLDMYRWFGCQIDAIDLSKKVGTLIHRN